MDIKEEKLALWLSVVSLLVLLVNYALIEIKDFSLSLGALQLSGVKVGALLPMAAAIALLLGMLIYHVLNLFSSLAGMYRLGYAESPLVERHFKDRLIEETGTEKYASPRGGLAYTLLPGRFDLGQWQRTDGSLSGRVIISPGWKVHLSGVVYGIRRCHTFRVLLKWYGPIVLAVWAIGAIAV